MGVAGAFTAPRPLRTGDDLSGFSCGQDLVDEWLAHRAAKARERGTAVVYVSFYDGVLAGFYSLSAHSVSRDDVAGGWARRNAPGQIPAVLLGMLGVDRRFQGRRLGAMLLRDAIVRAGGVSGEIGARMLVVDPADEAARSFYARHGFEPLQGTSRMYVRLP